MDISLVTVFRFSTDISLCVRVYVCMYEGVSKSRRTVLITRKSLVFHEFPDRVCCGGVFE